MKLRWLVKKYPVPTKEQCVELLNSDSSVCTMSQAYNKLKKANVTTLQMLLYEPSCGEVVGNWVDIPVVEEFINEQINTQTPQTKNES